MTIDEFWEIVDKVDAAAEGDMDEKCDLLGEALAELPPAEVKAFSDHFNDCMERAYTWELWAAAYIIGGGCSDDSFSDFRSTLISTGRALFELVVANPDELTDMAVDEDNAFYEGYQYVAAEVYEEMTDEEMPARATPYPESPSGKSWEEEKAGEVWPRLAQKHGFGT